MKKTALLLFIVVFTSSCKKDDSVNSVDDTTQTIHLDCVGGNCQELIVPGDPYQNNPDFYGYADPSIRKDPNSNAIWLSYSFPHYKVLDGTTVPSVSIHLANSMDGGANWSFVKELFEPVTMNNPADPGQEGFLDHETINLIPIKFGVNNFWCAARLNYFIPKTGGFSSRPSNSFHISIVKADTPESLSTGETSIIGGKLTDATWNPNTVLIPPDLQSDFFFWNEPALYFDDQVNKLYLIMVAFVYNGGVPVMSKNNIYVYSTNPDGNPQNWNWEYNGQLVNQAIANELGGERITQTDIAKGIDGKLLMIATPDDWNSDKNDFNHKGCKVVEIKSLQNPELERDSEGKLRVRLSITASDANDLGSGASAYDPNSETGVLFTKRIKTEVSLTSNIWKTGIKP